MKKVAIAIISVLSVHYSYGQSTFERVYTILQTNCTSSCHNTINPSAGLLLDGTVQQVFDNLVDVDPVNSDALSKQNKLIDPGYPEKSFLLRKVNNGFDEMLILHTGEGTPMLTEDTLSLTNVEVELIHQWILHGATRSDTVIDEQLLVDYYENGMGLPEVIRPLSPTEEGANGVQLRIGPIYLYPNQEVEYFKKAPLRLDGPKDVIKQKLEINWQSHHYTLFNYDPTYADDYPDELVLVSGAGDQLQIHLWGQVIGAFDSSKEVELPLGTAYKWGQDAVVVLNYHIRNYSPDSILKAEGFINIYYEDQDPQVDEMFMEFPVYGFPNPYLLQIPNTGQPYKETFEFYEPNSNEIWDIWRLQGHTHSIGTDFDIFHRNPDGTKGSQIYEGMYNTDYTFYQGYYDYSHSPVRTWNNFLSINMSEGLILEATWLNNSADTIGFGLTTREEMFAAYLQFVKREPSPVAVMDVEQRAFSLFPNPTNGTLQLSLDVYPEGELSLNLSDLSGKLIHTFEWTNLEQGKGMQISLDELSLKQGTYLLSSTNGDILPSKVVYIK